MAYVDVAVRRVVARMRERLAQTDAELPDLGWMPEGADAPPAATGPLAQLEPLQSDVLVAAGLIELDIRYGSLFAILQEPLQARRPCIGLLSWLLGEPGDDLPATCQALVRRGILAVDNETDPRSEWVLRVPVPVWDLVRTGRIDPESLPPGLRLRGGFPCLREVAVGAGQRPVLTRMPALLSDPGLSAVVVRGSRGSGRTTLIGAAAAERGLDLLVHEGDPSSASWKVFEALASLADVLPVARVDPGPGETLELPALPGHDGPLGIVAGRSGGLAGDLLEHAITVTLQPSGAPDRRALWAAGGLDACPRDFDDIVERFLLTPGNIRRTAPLAALQARANGRDHVTVEDVRAATRTLRRQELETLATFVEPLPPGVEPVLTASAQSEFETLVRRCRHRERLTQAAAQPGLSRGVRALFSGSSGTGKTLAARYLAARLDLDLYRVDLAAVVNKYIGETERNLDRVLARAEELDVVLLLDEGDALMTKRTDVSNANDRYANLETDFLLQRLETFDGIVVVTSNSAGRIDQAFLRRIDVSVDFVPPDAEQRWQIWQAHLPAGQGAPAELIEEVAMRCALTGGQIRNAALHATLLAVDRGAPVGETELLEGLRREYRRAGATYPMARRER